MDLRFIDKGAKITLQVREPGDVVIAQYDGFFADKIKHVTFTIVCDELYDSHKEYGNNVLIYVEFFHVARIFAFTSKIVGQTVHDGQKMLVLTQISEIKETTRRASPRIDMSINVSAFYSDRSNPDKGYTIRGSTIDVSGDGLGMLSDDDMPGGKAGQEFLLTFTLGGYYTFQLPAKVLRINDNPQTTQYKFEYGFLFDFTDISSERSRLITAMLDYQLKRL